MNFGEFKHLDWLKYDRFGLDIFVHPSKHYMCEWLKNSGIEYDYSEDEDSLVEKVKELSNKQKLYWEFKKINGVNYLDIIESSLDPWNGDYDDCEISLLDLTNFKVPTLFLELN